MGATAATIKKVSEWAPVFIDALRETGNVTAAARAAGIDRSTAYRYRNKDTAPAREFAAAWDDALEEAIDSLEAEAWRRARDGVDHPVIYEGEITDTYKKYSDTLLIFLLKANRPQKYRDNIDITSGGQAVRFLVTYDDDVRPLDGDGDAD